MIRLRPLFIRGKIVLISVIVATTTLALTAFSLFIFESVSIRKQTVETLVTILSVIGSNSTAAISFADKKAATETLSAIKFDQEIVFACIYDQNKSLFVSYEKIENKGLCPFQPDEYNYRFQENGLSMTYPIVLDQEQIGTIQILSNLSSFYSYIRAYMITVLVIISLAIVLAYLLSTKLQRIISQPILTLANTTQYIASHKDYSVRVKRTTRDEIATLIEGFNHMLDQIESQNSTLQHQANLLMSILNNIGDGVVVTRINGEVLIWNPAAYKIIPIGPQKVRPEDSSKIYGFYKADKETYWTENPLLVGLQGISLNQAEVFMLNPLSSSGVWLSVTTAPLKDEKGQISAAVAVIRNITERKQIEESLRASQEKLTEAVQIREDFLSVAAHELRTPLTPLKLQIQVIYDIFVNDKFKALSAEQLKRMLQSAKDQVDRLSKLVNNLLDVSRISVGRLALSFEKTDLSKLTNDLIERHLPEIVAAKCPLEKVIEPNLFANVDRVRIEQVLTNLISNAIKYGAGSLICIDLSRNNGFAQVKVQDHGIGIEPTEISRIFGRFERAASVSHFGGLGLGLYIAKQIIDAHRGAIEVESSPGKGTSFVVKIPIGV